MWKGCIQNTATATIVYGYKVDITRVTIACGGGVVDVRT